MKNLGEKEALDGELRFKHPNFDAKPGRCRHIQQCIEAKQVDSELAAG